MNRKALVEIIVGEVLRLLHGHEKRPDILILAARGSEAAQSVLSHLGRDAEVSFLEDLDGVDNPDRVILPRLSCTQMADLACGRASDPLMEKVFARLLSGKGVEVFEFEYLSYRQTAPGRLFSLYKSYQKTLKDFGLKGFEIIEKADVSVTKKLVTENDINELHKAGVSALRVPSAAILTPLAVDCARERGVRVERI